MLNQLLTRLPIRLKGERAALTISNAGGLIDEMATLVLAEGSHQLLAKETEAVWAIWPLRSEGAAVSLPLDVLLGTTKDRRLRLAHRP